jgi:fucose permease
VTEARRKTQLIPVFVAMGISASLFPAAIPALSAEMQVNPSALISAVPAMFGGLLVAVAMTPFVATRFSEGSLMRLGLGFMASGLAVAGLATQPELFVLGAVVVGLGFGITEVAGTSSAKRLHENTSSKLTQLNTAFALAALTTPIGFLALGAILGPLASFLIAASLALLFAILHRGESDVRVKIQTKTPLNLGILLFAVAALCYVGAETLIAGWSSVLINQIGGLEAEFAAIGGSAFWALFAIGRVLSTLITPNWLPGTKALVLWPAISAASLLSAAFGWQAGSATLILIAFAVATIAAGPCYALIIGVALDMQQASNSTALTSMLILCGSIGGFLFPVFAQAIGGYQIVAIFSGFGFLAVLVLVVFGSFVGRSNRVTTEVS